ncbi:MAG: hypothetical protein JSV09_07930 [Thermoplasmata archaeon]|nr:MAG: hypothetical protein JSV09_07930 [Thermoplasmata archaeon]
MDIVTVGWILVTLIFICGLILFFFSSSKEGKQKQLTYLEKSYQKGKLKGRKLLKFRLQIARIRIAIKIFLIIIIFFTIMSLLTFIFVWGTAEQDFHLMLISSEIAIIFLLYTGLKFLKILNKNFMKVIESHKIQKE